LGGRVNALMGTERGRRKRPRLTSTPLPLLRFLITLKRIPGAKNFSLQRHIIR
jgi:hypothetical protein